MNKKQRFILGASIIVVLFIFIVQSDITSNQLTVSEAVTAKVENVEKIIIVNGSLVKDSDKWDALNRTLTFKMTDGIATIDVFWQGTKPDIPPDNTDIQIIVTGKFDDDIFISIKQPLTKCPSKYEGDIQDSVK